MLKRVLAAALAAAKICSKKCEDLKKDKNWSPDELFGIRVHHAAYCFTRELVVITVFYQTQVFAKKKGSRN